MNIFDLIDNVKEGLITSTHDYYTPVIETKEDSIRYSTFLSIIEAINSGHVEGELDCSTEVINYKCLRLTPKGESFHKFYSLTFDQIKKPTIWQIMRNGIIGAISGKVFVAIFGLIIIFLMPNIENQIINFFDCTISFVKSFVA